MTEPAIARDEGDGTVCSVDGAVVHVRRREARGEVPAFEYVIGTDEETPVAVRVRQPIPDDVDLEAIGFPPACEDDWRLDGSTLVLEAPVEPGTPVRTAWGVDRDGHPPIEPPSIDVVALEQPRATRGEGEVAGAESAAADRSGPSAADGDVTSAGEPDETDASDGAEEAVPSTFDLSDPPEALSDSADAEPGDPDAVTSGAARDDATGDDALAPEVAGDAGDDPGSTEARRSGAAAGAPERGGPPAGEELLVARLAAELRSEDVDEEHRAALQDALAVRLSDSTNAFVEHLQQKLERRVDRAAEEVESLEESIERVYGVKADASELDAVKRGLTDLDDSKVGQSSFRELRSDQETLAERVERTAEHLESVRTSQESLEATVAEVEETAAAASSLAELREEVESLRETAATESDLEERAEQLVATAQRLDDRIDDVAADHDELAAEVATGEDLETLRKSHRTVLDGATSDLESLEATLADEYTSDAEISAEIGRRLRRSLGTLVLFGVGVTGLLSTVPLALAGSDAAAVTFAGGAASLVAWWALVGRGGGSQSLLARLPSPGDLLG